MSLEEGVMRQRPMLLGPMSSLENRESETKAGSVLAADGVGRRNVTTAARSSPAAADRPLRSSEAFSSARSTDESSAKHGCDETSTVISLSLMSALGGHTCSGKVRPKLRTTMFLEVRAAFPP